MKNPVKNRSMVTISKFYLKFKDVNYKWPKQFTNLTWMILLAISFKSNYLLYDWSLLIRSIWFNENLTTSESEPVNQNSWKFFLIIHENCPIPCIKIIYVQSALSDFQNWFEWIKWLFFALKNNQSLSRFI